MDVWIELHARLDGQMYLDKVLNGHRGERVRGLHPIPGPARPDGDRSNSV
jgi:hypothetical protein